MRLAARWARSPRCAAQRFRSRTHRACAGGKSRKARWCRSCRAAPPIASTKPSETKRRTPLPPLGAADGDDVKHRRHPGPNRGLGYGDVGGLEHVKEHRKHYPAPASTITAYNKSWSSIATRQSASMNGSKKFWARISSIVTPPTSAREPTPGVWPAARSRPFLPELVYHAAGPKLDARAMVWDPTGFVTKRNRAMSNAFKERG